MRFARKNASICAKRMTDRRAAPWFPVFAVLKAFLMCLDPGDDGRHDLILDAIIAMG